MIALHRGDRVRLTSAYAAALPYRRRKTMDWAAREGVVASVTARCVRIVWDGRKASEEFAPAVVERAQAREELKL